MTETFDNKYKIIFVITTESGRISPESGRMVGAFRDALPFINSNYSLIVNKCSKRAEKVWQSPKGQAILARYFCEGALVPTTYAMPKDEDLEDEDNVVKPLPWFMVTWLWGLCPWFEGGARR